MKKTAIRVTALCLSLLLSWLLLLSSCAPAKPAEEQPPEDSDIREPTPEDSDISEQTPEPEEAPTDVAYDANIVFSYPEDENYQMNTLLVTLKASGSDPEKIPTPESFGRKALVSVEPLMNSAYQTADGWDWERYFAVEGRQRENFRWRLRLTFDCADREDFLYEAEVIYAKPEVSEVQFIRTQDLALDTKDTDFEISDPERLIPEKIRVTIKHSYSDPLSPYSLEDFAEIGAVRLFDYYNPLSDSAVWERETISGQWCLTLTTDAATEEELREKAALLLAREDVQCVAPDYYGEVGLPVDPNPWVGY